MKNSKQFTKLYKAQTLLSIIVLALITDVGYAQRDSTKKGQTVDITSSYRPVLRNAVKINLSALPFISDTSRPKLAYDIPAQNLFFSYQPIPLKPLSLQQDTSLDLGLRNYLKAGFGNLATPYVKGSFSFGDGKSSLVNLKADYISSKGPIANQDFSEVSIKGLGSYFTKSNEVNAGIGFGQHEYYQYGYDHAMHNYTKESIRRRYQDIQINGGFRNIAVNNFNVNYNPNIQANIFSRENTITESSLIADVPVEKKFGESISFKVDAKADVTSLTNKSTTTNVKTTNNLFTVAPELIYYSDKLHFMEVFHQPGIMGF